MTSRLPARRLASALLLCAVAAPALADPDAGAAAAAPGATQPAAPQRRPPPMVLVVPLGFGVLLPLTLPTTTPRVRAAPAGGAAQATSGPVGSGGGSPGRAEAP